MDGDRGAAGDRRPRPLVAAATDQGWARRGDATEMVTQTVAQLLAFSGEHSDDRPAWDGEERMKVFQGNDGATGG